MTERSSIHHLPTGAWAFDDGVTDVFEDMLRRSIPDYDAMRRVVFDVGRRFVRPGTDVLDIGCSRGDALAPYIAEFGYGARYVGVEVSQPMLETVRKRFATECERGIVEIQDIDLRKVFPTVQASLTLSVLTLQFVPVEHRGRVVRNVFEHTVDGGAFVLVEKILGNSAQLTEMLIDDASNALIPTNGAGSLSTRGLRSRISRTVDSAFARSVLYATSTLRSS